MKALSFPKNTWGSPGVTDVQIWHPSIFSLASCGLILFWKRQRTIRNYHQKEEHTNNANKRCEKNSLLTEKWEFCIKPGSSSLRHSTDGIRTHSHSCSCRSSSLPWRVTYQFQGDDLPRKVFLYVHHTLLTTNLHDLVLTLKSCFPILSDFFMFSLYFFNCNKYEKNAA